MLPRFRPDELNKTLLYVGGGLLLLTWLLGYVPQAPGGAFAWTLFALRFPAFACIGWAAFRMFSKNKAARATENQRWLVFQVKLRDFFRGTAHGSSGTQQPRTKPPKPPRQKSNIKKQWEETKQYRHPSCPQCTQKLRVPRGKGKIRVTCSRCGNKFIAKS